MDRQLTQCFSGLQLLTQVIIADITSLRWRGLVSGLVSLPFLLNAFVGSRLAAAMIEGPGWRWGCKSVSKAHLNNIETSLRQLPPVFNLLRYLDVQE